MIRRAVLFTTIQSLAFGLSTLALLNPEPLRAADKPAKKTGKTAAPAKTAEKSTTSPAKKQIVKYVRFQSGRTVAHGIVEGETVTQISGSLYGNWKKTDKTFPLKDVKILVPTTPSKVIALAGNYRDHLGSAPAPKFPEPFFKVPSSLQRQDGPVIQPKSTEPVHFEAELVIVIGKRAKKVSEAKALDYVLGVTCGNDISARIWQNGGSDQKKDVQWWRAKGADTFGPCGPFIVSGIDYDNLNMELRVNGAVKQKTSTKNMIHNVAQTVSFISQFCTLEPGDLIFTGTPGKTSGMQPGDVVEVEIEHVGVLRNKIVLEK